MMWMAVEDGNGPCGINLDPAVLEVEDGEEEEEDNNDEEEEEEKEEEEEVGDAPVVDMFGGEDGGDY